MLKIWMRQRPFKPPQSNILLIPGRNQSTLCFPCRAVKLMSMLPILPHISHVFAAVVCSLQTSLQFFIPWHLSSNYAPIISFTSWIFRPYSYLNTVVIFVLYLDDITMYMNMLMSTMTLDCFHYTCVLGVLDVFRHSNLRKYINSLFLIICLEGGYQLTSET